MKISDILSHFVLKYLAVPKSPKILPDKTHIACIGDSITSGVGVGGRTEQTWEYYLNQILGEDYQVINYGISTRAIIHTEPTSSTVSHETALPKSI